jgi:hypothetical protein
MEPCAALVFPRITPEQFTKLAAKARASGFELNGNSGSASKFGVEIVWNYNPESQKLTFQCIDTPFFVKPQDVYAKIQAIVSDCTA